MYSSRRRNDFRRCTIERGHGSYRVFYPIRLRNAALQCRCDHARANRLGEDQSIACDRACICKYSVRVNETSDGVTELDLCVTNTVPTHNYAACLVHL